MAGVALKPLAETQTWRLENAAVRLEVEKRTGFIRALFFKARKVDLFRQLRSGIPGYAGALRIYDELDEAWYEDLKTPFKLSHPSLRGNTLTFTKQYEGAPFTIAVSMRMDRGMFHWEVEAKKRNKSVADRSLRVFFCMPLIAGWDVWAPCLAGERKFDGMTPFEHCYTQISYVSDSEIILPMISHFSRELDVGYSVLEPIEAQVPAAKFVFSNADRCFTWRANAKLHDVPVLEAVNYCIGLVGQRPMRTKIMLAFHEGDWRPALGQVFRRWNKFFVPKNERIYEQEGMFGGLGIHHNRMDPKEVAAYGTKYFEVHGHFSHYGDYYNEGQDRWLDISAIEHVWLKFDGKKDACQVMDWIASHTPQEIVALLDGREPGDYTREQAEDRLYTTRKFVREYVKGLARHGVHPFWYFNYTDGFRPEVEKRWPDSICRNEDGSYQASGWRMCHNMNSDPRYSFGKFMIASAGKIVKEHPKLAGFFLDCFRHFEIDFAHDDGITVANNRPAYSVNFSYDDIETIIEPMLRRNNLCTFANKPQTIRSMRWVDAMMLEGDGDCMEEKYFYSCLAKPIIFLWTSNAAGDDENCRRAVLYGCYPRTEYARNGLRVAQQEAVKRRRRYLPLCAAFSRRVFCFEPDPLRVPKACRGKLYTVGQDYIAPIVNLNLDETLKARYTKTPYAMFRVKRGHDVGKAGVMYPGMREWKYVDFRFNGTFIAVPLQGFTNCAVVKLFVTRETGKAIGAARFQGPVDSCGDPDSSFTDLGSL